jgi:predicted Zn finger-like uncharacterized protein
LQQLELYDIDESEYRALLHEIPKIWKKNSSFFDLGLHELFKTFGESDDFVFGVHIYNHHNRGLLFVVLTEYHRDSRIAVFRINAVLTIVTFPEPSREKAEIRLREMLEELTYEDLEKFGVADQYRESGEVFVCPRCKAQYMMRVLNVAADGKVECQNCLALIDPNEIHIGTSHDS